jgi:hypothetical protein
VVAVLCFAGSPADGSGVKWLAGRLLLAIHRADQRLSARLLPGAAEALGAAAGGRGALGGLVAAVMALHPRHGPPAEGRQAELEAFDFARDGHGFWEPAMLLAEPYRKKLIRPLVQTREEAQSDMESRQWVANGGYGEYAACA